MYTAYANQINEEALYSGRSNRTSDIRFSPIVGGLLVTIWMAICMAGFGIMFLARQPVVGAAIIAVPTFIGMLMKPTFALCVMMLVLPTGAGLGYAGVFSLDRGIGIALAVSFLINALITRPGIHMRNRALWIVGLYTLWIVLASLAGQHLSFELRRAFTQFQLLILFFITYWILETNGPKTLIWTLRSYVFGTLGTIILAIATGAAIRAVQETGEVRYAATLGRAIDANMLGALVALAFLAAVYLFARDKSAMWRIVYLGAILFLPLMMLRIGSRGAIVGLALTMLSPLVFVRQVLRRPALAALLIVAIVVASLSAGLLVKKTGLEDPVAQRLTDVGYAKESFDSRMRPISKAVETAITRPMGTSFYGWFEESGLTIYPHSDFFLVLGVYGIPGAILFALLLVFTVLIVRRTALGLEKIYSRSTFIFLLAMGLTIGQVYKKYFWVFLAVVIAIERISWLYAEMADERTHEETADIDYLPYVSQ